MSSKTTKDKPETVEEAPAQLVLADDTMSPEIDKIVPALIAAHAEMAMPTKDATNEYYDSTYPTLKSVIDAARPTLAKHGLTVVQTGDVLGGHNVLVTTLYHESTQWLRGRFRLSLQKDGPQGFGSALTYFRRYMEMAMLHMAPEDDDAEAATRRGSANAAKLDEHKSPRSKARAQQEAGVKETVSTLRTEAKRIMIGMGLTKDEMAELAGVVRADIGVSESGLHTLDGITAFVDELQRRAKNEKQRKSAA